MPPEKGNAVAETAEVEHGAILTPIENNQEIPADNEEADKNDDDANDVRKKIKKSKKKSRKTDANSKSDNEGKTNTNSKIDKKSKHRRRQEEKPWYERGDDHKSTYKGPDRPDFDIRSGMQLKGLPASAAHFKYVTNLAKRKKKKKRDRQREKSASNNTTPAVPDADTEKAKAKAEAEAESANTTAKKILQGVLKLGEKVDSATMSMRRQFLQTTSVQPGGVGSGGQGVR